MTIIDQMLACHAAGMTVPETAAKLNRDPSLIYRWATQRLPPDTALADRKRVVDAARPDWGGCSWPRKAWQAARRDYLVRYGYEPRTKAHAERKAAVIEDLPLFGEIKKEE